MPISTKNGLYALQDVPDRGKGLIATTNIPKGTRILSEKPLMVIPARKPVSYFSISQQLEALSEEQRDAFLSMKNVHPSVGDKIIGIFRTNFLCLTKSGDLAIFQEACRINHDCESNTFHYWNDNIKRHTQSQKRDRVIEKILHFAKLERSSQSVSPDEALSYLRSQVCLYNELGLEDYDFARVHGHAASLFIKHGDLARGRLFAQMAASMFETLLGNDSIEVIHYACLARNPASDPQYGFSMMWHTSVGDVPHGLTSDDFEDWLWKTKEPEGLERPMSPLYQGWFSGFADLPHRDDIYAGGSVKIPHSCFLGEIVAVDFCHRLEFEIRDIYDETIPLRFYTNGEGAELPPEEYSRGDTIAVLDASRYEFEDGVSGIRHEEPWMVKVFPLCLDEVLALNDQVHEFSFRQQNNTRKCHGCGRTSAEASMKRCDKCLLFWYCNSECQDVGRNTITKTHEDYCKFLQDPDLRALFLIKWKDVQNHIHFPLKVIDAS
ncbi:uncharacterized protein CPUR_02961 [Claviceps purpurea 20.1]|uniref:Uncharacterized protein n=1 Tax=Claviceps purpurea (strain 20.1) TaxID=1111077 RepID=M1W8H2_CLAP2|nr:uncharacterized protein CPUR_02961 [Claviceps purpurea 20.1]